MTLHEDLIAAAAALRAKLGQLPAEIEAHFGAFLSHVKAKELMVDAEIAHLTSLGYVVTKAPPAATESPATS